MSIYFKKILSVLLITILVGCTDYNIETPEIDNSAILMMNVGAINIVPYEGAESNILPIAASALTKQWFERKIKISNKGEARFEVEIADARTYVDRASNVKFNAYTTEIKVNYKLYESQQNLASMVANSSLKMTREVKKDVSIGDEDKFFANNHRQLVDRMNREFPAQIEKYFSEKILMTR